MSTPSLGTAFSDGIRIGGRGWYNLNGGIIGMPMGPFVSYTIIPKAGYPIVNALTNPTNSGSLPISAVAGSSSFVSFQGYSNVLQLDCCRNLDITTTGTAVTAPVLTISGWDIWNNKVVEEVTINATNVVSNKTYSKIMSIYTTSLAGLTGFTLSSSKNFGSPFLINDDGPGIIQNVFVLRDSQVIPYSNTNVANTVDVNAGDDSSPSTLSGSDVRGTIKPWDALANHTYTLMNYVNAADPSFYYDEISQFALNPAGRDSTYENIYGVEQYSEGWQV